MTIIATYLSMFAVDDSFDAIQIKCDREVHVVPSCLLTSVKL